MLNYLVAVCVDRKLEGMWVMTMLISLLCNAELYDNLGMVGASIKQHLVDGVRNVWVQLNEFARSHTTTGPQGLAHMEHMDMPLPGV